MHREQHSNNNPRKQVSENYLKSVLILRLVVRLVSKECTLIYLSEIRNQLNSHLRTLSSLHSSICVHLIVSIKRSFGSQRVILISVLFYVSSLLCGALLSTTYRLPPDTVFEG